MARHAHEFNCTNCNWWNYPMLSEAMNGNYTVKCGHCQHDHYRVIVNGVVTEERHNAKYGTAETIHVMPSASTEKKRQLGLVAQFRQLVTAGLAE